jgi:hypothetical protein
MSAPIDQSFEPLIIYEVIGKRQTENARRENADALAWSWRCEILEPRICRGMTWSGEGNGKPRFGRSPYLGFALLGASGFPGSSYLAP